MIPRAGDVFVIWCCYLLSVRLLSFLGSLPKFYEPRDISNVVGDEN